MHTRFCEYPYHSAKNRHKVPSRVTIPVALELVARASQLQPVLVDQPADVIHGNCKPFDTVNAS
eukprot:582339-Pleurochrysis_carterae.AAC.1